MILRLPSGHVALGSLATAALRRVAIDTIEGRAVYPHALHRAALDALVEGGLVGIHYGGDGRLIMAAAPAADILTALDLAAFDTGPMDHVDCRLQPEPVYAEPEPEPEPEGRWWVMAEAELLAAMRRVQAGDDPAVALLELTANATVDKGPT